MGSELLAVELLSNAMIYIIELCFVATVYTLLIGINNKYECAYDVDSVPYIGNDGEDEVD